MISGDTGAASRFSQVHETGRRWDAVFAGGSGRSFRIFSRLVTLASTSVAPRIVSQR